MKKAPDAFRTISEVADWLEVQAHVLRFWESKFTQVKPVKRAGGRRYYRPSDMLLIGGIKTLLHDEGMTIKGVQKVLREKGVEHVSSLSRVLDLSAGSEEDVIEAVVAPAEDEAGETPNVVTFQSRKSRRRKPAAPPPEAVEEAEAEAEPEMDLEPAGDVAEEPAPEPEQEPEPASVRAEPDILEEEPDEPSLPSFLHRSARPAPEPEPEPEPEEVVEAGPPKPRVVDAPDPPAEAEIAVDPGPLGRLAAIDKLPPEGIDALAALASEIRARAGQTTGSGPA